MDRRKSYLCARDDGVRTNDSDLNCLEVILRVKKNADKDLYNVDGNNYIHKDMAKSNRQYTFSKIYRSVCNQVDIFNNIVKPKFLHFINGNNYSLLAYGISGSGKTYTIIGDNSSPGIVPRSLEYLFRTVPCITEEPQWLPLDNGQGKSLSSIEAAHYVNLRKEALKDIKDLNYHKETYKIICQNMLNVSAAIVDDQDVKCDLWVTFAEIYNETVFDLLNNESNKPKLKICNIRGNAYIKDLTKIHISSDVDAYLLLQLGLDKIKYASTGMNDHSSRSHCVFSIKLVQYLRDHQPIISEFKLYDLAGSEKQKKSHNVGDRLVESNAINKSLLTLNKCMKMALTLQNKPRTHVPIRESKLTQLLQRGLLGHEPLTMIVTLNPIKDSLNDTENVLNFSAIAQKVLLKHELENLRLQIASTSNEDLNEEKIWEEIYDLEYIISIEALSFEERKAINDGVLSEFSELCLIREKEFMTDHNGEKLDENCEKLEEEIEELMDKDEELRIEIKELFEKATLLGIDPVHLEEQDIIMLSDSCEIIMISDDEDKVVNDEDDETDDDDDDQKNYNNDIKNKEYADENKYFNLRESSHYVEGRNYYLTKLSGVKNTELSLSIVCEDDESDNFKDFDNNAEEENQTFNVQESSHIVQDTNYHLSKLSYVKNTELSLSIGCEDDESDNFKDFDNNAKEENETFNVEELTHIVQDTKYHLTNLSTIKNTELSLSIGCEDDEFDNFEDFGNDAKEENQTFNVEELSHMIKDKHCDLKNLLSIKNTDLSLSLVSEDDQSEIFRKNHSKPEEENQSFNIRESSNIREDTNCHLMKLSNTTNTGPPSSIINFCSNKDENQTFNMRESSNNIEETNCHLTKLSDTASTETSESIVYEDDQSENFKNFYSKVQEEQQTFNTRESSHNIEDTNCYLTKLSNTELSSSIDYEDGQSENFKKFYRKVQDENQSFNENELTYNIEDTNNCFLPKLSDITNKQLPSSKNYVDGKSSNLKSVYSNLQEENKL